MPWPALDPAINLMDPIARCPATGLPYQSLAVRQKGKSYFQRRCPRSWTTLVVCVCVG